MTILYLVRHAAHPLLGRELVGRRPCVALSDEGAAQAERLGAVLAERPLRAVLSSPLERARQTAAPIARRHGLPVTVERDLNEVDFGEWTGRSFTELDRDPAWQRFNRNRSSAAIPGGERILEVQARIVGLIERLGDRHPDESIVLVSHGDVIRAAVLHYLGMPLDFVHRLEVRPASISILSVEDAAPRLAALDLAADSPHGLPAVGGRG